MHGQISAKFLGCQRTAVQTKAVPVLARAESVRENARQIFRDNSHAIVNHADLDAVGRHFFDLHRHLFIRAVAFFAGVRGVGEEIDEDLQNPCADPP